MPLILAMNAYKVKIVVKAGDEFYDVDGALLADGRLLTFGTGERQTDDLWQSIVMYDPNGGDKFDHALVIGELVEVDTQTIAEAGMRTPEGLKLLSGDELHYLKRKGVGLLQEGE